MSRRTTGADHASGCCCVARTGHAHGTATTAQSVHHEAHPALTAVPGGSADPASAVPLTIIRSRLVCAVPQSIGAASESQQSVLLGAPVLPMSSCASSRPTSDARALAACVRYNHAPTAIDAHRVASSYAAWCLKSRTRRYAAARCGFLCAQAHHATWLTSAAPCAAHTGPSVPCDELLLGLCS